MFVFNGLVEKISKVIIKVNCLIRSIGHRVLKNTHFYVNMEDNESV
jgi:hypothetical protein